MINNPKNLVTSLAILLLVIAIILYAVLDWFFAISFYPIFTLVYLAGWTLLAFLLNYPKPTRRTLFMMAVLTGLIISIRFVNWDTRKPFLNDLYRVEVGMTTAEVDKIMIDYIKGTGWPANPNPAAAKPGELTLPDVAVYRHTNAGWGDSDWGVVKYQNGRVIYVKYLPD